MEFFHKIVHVAVSEFHFSLYDQFGRSNLKTIFIIIIATFWKFWRCFRISIELSNFFLSFLWTDRIFYYSNQVQDKYLWSRVFIKVRNFNWWFESIKLKETFSKHYRDFENSSYDFRFNIIKKFPCSSDLDIDRFFNNQIRLFILREALSKSSIAIFINL